MANDYFKFKQFTVHQERCAMKVGTDGTLLGAWAQVPEEQSRILDIGTGTGLIAMMMAQRFPQADIVGIDIDKDAVEQASENVMNSPFSERINICQKDVSRMEDADGFDAIVCNPPYFVGSLRCPDEQRTIARHTVSLTYKNLTKSAYRLLKKEGLFSLVIPMEKHSELEALARMEGFFPSRVCLVKTTPLKAPKRQLIEFTKLLVNKIYKKEVVIELSPNKRSPWYQALTQEFYIK